MFKQLQQSLSGLFWLIGLAALAIFLIFLLNGPPDLRVAQEPEGTETPTGDTSPLETPTPLPAETATPVLTATVTLTSTVTLTPVLTETPTVAATETSTPPETETPTPLPTETIEPTPTVAATSPPDSDEIIPVDEALQGETILYEASYPVTQEVWRNGLYIASPTDSSKIGKRIAFEGEVVISDTIYPIDEVQFYFHSVSPDQRYLLLLAPAGETGGIPFIFDRQTDQIKPIFKDYPWSGGRVYDWSLDGRKVLFYIDGVALTLVDVETSEIVRLDATDKYSYGPKGASLSPDGEQVAYITLNYRDYPDQPAPESLWIINVADGEPRSVETLWEHNPAAKEPRLLFDIQGITTLFDWAKEGILYWESGEPKEKGQIPDTGPLWLTNPDGTDRRDFPEARLTIGLGPEPKLSPDGTRLAYIGLTSDEKFGCEQTPEDEYCPYRNASIYILAIADGTVSRLTNGIEPAWSPNGEQMAFLSDRTGASEVWIIGVDGSGLRQLTNDGLPKQRVLWLGEEVN